MSELTMPWQACLKSWPRRKTTWRQFKSIAHFVRFDSRDFLSQNGFRHLVPLPLRLRMKQFSTRPSSVMTRFSRGD